MITYSKHYLVYISYSEHCVLFVVCGGLVGSVRLKYYLRAPLAVSSPVCSAHYFNIGEAGPGACLRHWKNPVLHAQTDQDFPGASCDSTDGAGDGNQWRYINSNALKWATSQ